MKTPKGDGMSFSGRYPTFAKLLGTKAALPDAHGAMIKKSAAANMAIHEDDAAVEHFGLCDIPDVCALYNSGEAEPNYKLDLIEWALAQIEAAVGQEALRRGFARKLMQKEGFFQTIAEIAVSATCAVRGKLVGFEVPTGKKRSSDPRARGYDADVRSEFAGSEILMEVTLRTDGWLKDIGFQVEDFLNDVGKLTDEKKAPEPKIRSLLTDEEIDDLRRLGLPIPQREKGPGEPFPEPKNVFDKLQAKAVKFNPDGLHVLVLATIQYGFPRETHVRMAVYGAGDYLPTGGMFNDGTYEQISGVLFLDVFTHLGRLQLQASQNPSEYPSRNTNFPNSFACCALPADPQQALVDAFEAKQERPPALLIQRRS
jgi:hypothetical protein